MTALPSVSVVIPVLNETVHIDECLDAIDAQTYAGIVEVLVVDGGSDDDTVARAQRRSGVRVLSNPRRIQAAALNIALGEAEGDVIVRVDGHCTLAADYVERCVAALVDSGAAMVGGAMSPVGSSSVQRGVALAMTSPLGAGPARFHVGGGSAWVDTVYLGAYRRELALEVGGYDENVGVNEDAEFAYRMGQHGGIWFDPTIRSSYVPRASVQSVARQFYRYGRSRAATMRKHPGSVAYRQLAAPALVVGLVSPARRWVALGYVAILAAGFVDCRRRDAEAAPTAVVMLPTMHLSWGLGFFRGLVRRAGS